MVSDKVNIPEYAKIKVYWDDSPENYSRASKLKVRNYFSKKYGIDKNNINVVYRPIKIGKDGEVIEITGAGVDNILDRNYQVELMREWFKREAKTVDFQRILDLDTKVNGSLEDQSEIKAHRSWSLKWIFIDNFLSFGEKNFASLSGLNGLNLVTSEPSNQGGKTVFCVDAILFLLFGVTTKTKKNEQIFNTFSNKDELMVRGMIEVEDSEFIIERKMKRKSKKSGGWTVNNELNYYRLLPDGEEELLNEEVAVKTGELIKNNVGTESDFHTTILSTARNLEDLIESNPTENGRLLTKFIGLEVIEAKEVIAKGMYSEFNKNKKSNHYDIDTLSESNLELEGTIFEEKAKSKSLKNNLEECEKELIRLENRKEDLLKSKLIVDVEISQLNPETLERDIKTIIEKGLGFKEKIENFNKEIIKLKDATYDEYEFNELEKESRKLTIEIGGLNNELLSIGKVIDNLKNSENCETCKRPLVGVDNTDSIKEYEIKTSDIKKSIEIDSKKLSKVDKKIVKIKVDRDLVDKRDRLELERDKIEVEIDSLRNKITEKNSDLKKYKLNKSAITLNTNIDADISAVKTKVVVENTTKSTITQNIFISDNEAIKASKQLDINEALIKTLKKEVEIETIFKVYLEMIGKKGISKLVLRSVLPIINSELYRLLDDVCNFEVELQITDKNEVEFIIIKNEIIKSLKSGSGLERTLASLALRCVLGKISHLPTPNFITFDEVLGKVASDNLEKLKPMFDKIKDMFDIVFLITHNDLVKDWSDNTITVIKEKDISRVKINA